MHSDLVRSSDVRIFTEAVAGDEVQVHRGQALSHVGVAPGSWGWRALRDYVVGTLQARHGTVERPPAHIEAGIFKGFVKRWGPEEAARIAIYVCEVCEGRWGSRPIRVTAFCKAADPWFSQKVLERMDA